MIRPSLVIALRQIAAMADGLADRLEGDQPEDFPIASVVGGELAGGDAMLELVEVGIGPADGRTN